MKVINNIMLVVFFCMAFLVSGQDTHAKSGLKKGTVQEVIQVESYTYLRVIEAGETKWLAVPTIQVKIGESYFYKKGMAMPGFKSKELDRTFDEVIFLSYITRADAIDIDKGIVLEKEKPKAQKNAKKPTLNRLEMTIEKPVDAISIGELFANPEQYNGKSVKIKGEITKFNGGILGTNWIHFQDGTIHNEKYDLMVTSDAIVYIGDVVTFEGVVTLNKDFGSGYFYEVIMESATPLD